MRIAFHAINGVGLGHLVRATSLARELRDDTILVVTNAADVSLLRRHGLDFVKLPPRSGEPHADPDRCLTALPEPLEEAVLLAAFEAFAPDLVVFDTHAPARVVRALTERGARTVLVLRELRPATLTAFVASGGAIAFDRIVVPHEPGEVDLGVLAGHPVVATGPIVRALPAPTTPDAPHVVALAGGGGQPVDAARYVRAVADAHLLARGRFPRLRTTLVTGPYGAAPANVDAFEGLTVLRSPPDLDAILAAASLVVSQAGYNAVAEIRALAKPCVLVPGHRKSEDQRARALRLARSGAALLAKPEARAIADRVEEALGRLDAMRAAHVPLVPRNREAAAVVRGTLARGPAVKRVVLVAHDFAPKLGGMESVARGLAVALAGLGIEVIVYTTSRLGADTASGLPNVRPLFTPLPPPGRIDLERDLLLTIDAALGDRPDAIHLCHAGLAPWVPYLKAALPVVVTAHVHGNDLLAPWVTTTLPDYRAARVAGLSSADAVVAVSDYTRALAIAEGVAPERITTIANGVDPDRFEASDAVGGVVLLTVSRLAPRKGHRTVLHALARLRRPDVRYVFTGASETMRHELATLAAELGIRDQVEALGFVDEVDLTALYRRASIFLLLAEHADADVEGFGLALLEAAASGIPTIATRTGGIPEAIEDGVTGLLVPPGDSVAAAAAIARLLDDRALARRLGERGRARVRSTFAESRHAAKLLALWQRSSAVAPLPPNHLGIANAALLAHQARATAAAARAERAARRTKLARTIERGDGVRLRATSDGARLLPEVLADCAALGHAPVVEVKLRRFLEADFQRFALPRVSEVDVVHGLPQASSLVAELERLPPAAFARVGTVRLFLTPEARADGKLAASAVPEAHAIRRFFTRAGAVVVPPRS